MGFLVRGSSRPRAVGAVYLAMLVGLLACDWDDASRPSTDGVCGELSEVRLEGDTEVARRARQALARAEQFQVAGATWHCEPDVSACDDRVQQPLEVSISQADAPACEHLECPDGARRAPLKERLAACEHFTHVPVILRIAGAGAPESSSRLATLAVDETGAARVVLQSRGSLRLKEFFGLPADTTVRELVAIDVSAIPPKGHRNT